MTNQPKFPERGMQKECLGASTEGGIPPGKGAGRRPALGKRWHWAYHGRPGGFHPGVGKEGRTFQAEVGV